jgi:hypothetical protein
MIASTAAEFRRYQALGEAAIAQLADDELARAPSDDSNSVAVIVWHIAGNLTSRFTEFRTADGEKPWRQRDEEFVARSVTRDELLTKWESGWSALFGALAALTDADLDEQVIIRGQPIAIRDALLRAFGHISYHVGQIVFLAKSIRASEWRTLSIPKGGSGAYNRNPRNETAGRHAEALGRRPASS